MSGLQRQRGMTLIELIVATTLLALLMAMVYGGLRVATRAGESARSRADALNEVRVAQRVLRRQLRSALPVRGGAHDPAGDVARVFDGDGGRMRFVGPMPGYLGGGVHVQEIWLEGDAGDQRLMFSHRLAHPESGTRDSTQAQAPVVLIGHLAEASFSYFDADPGSSGTASWQARWEPAARFPALVRLEALRSGRHLVPWPTLVVAPRVTHARWSASVDTGG